MDLELKERNDKMSLIDKLYNVGLKKVVEATLDAEKLMTEARDAYDAEKKRLEKEKIRKRTL
jgi:hypothetical protein